MSSRGILALVGASGVAGAVIYYVHKLQDEERKVRLGNKQEVTSCTARWSFFFFFSFFFFSFLYKR